MIEGALHDGHVTTQSDRTVAFGNIFGSLD